MSSCGCVRAGLTLTSRPLYDYNSREYSEECDDEMMNKEELILASAARGAEQLPVRQNVLSDF